MSSTTPPPPPSSESSATNDDWRSNVQQSYRNTEVREIAKILASLEPGATFASKLRLAMQFENTIFSSADSLADYRKKLAKRLKKLKKSYKPAATAEESPTKKGDSKVLQLKKKYGDTLKFIVENSPVALKLMKEKAGPQKTAQLKLHTDNVRQWAMELGVLNEQQPHVKNVAKLETLLEQRIENIRSHVVKLAHPDLFLKETMDKLEPEFVGGGHAVKLLANATRKQLTNMTEFDKHVLLKSFETAQAPIPPRAQQKEEALLHLEKMRAASQVFLAFMALEDKTGLPPKMLTKCHDVATLGAKHILETTKSIAKDSSSSDSKITLEDAWNKVLEIPADVEEEEDETPPSKRIKLSPTIRSRVLLTPGRKTPSNLLSELKRKRAKLTRPDGQGSFLETTFGDAFKMTIYLVPLLVQLQEINCGEQLTIWGVTGSREVLRNVVAQRLRHASAQATSVLRKCFSSSASATRSDFEVEISEATALLQFIQLARSTYMPTWREDDNNVE